MGGLRSAREVDGRASFSCFNISLIPISFFIFTSLLENFKKTSYRIYSGQLKFMMINHSNRLLAQPFVREWLPKKRGSPSTLGWVSLLMGCGNEKRSNETT